MYEIQEKYRDENWQVMATTESGYNAECIVLALSTKWTTTQFRSVMVK